ncbi:MAG: hypothetical protein MJZ25_15665 [Fibrobacter sp.]|nr:hypothetical protein [Fibrobacter sp.]
MKPTLTYREMMEYIQETYPEIYRGLTSSSITPSNPSGKDGSYQIHFDGHTAKIYRPTTLSDTACIYIPEFNVQSLLTRKTLDIIAKRYRRSVNIDNMVIPGQTPTDLSYLFEDGSTKLPQFSGYWFYDETSGRRKVFLVNLETLDEFEIKPDAMFKLVVHNGIEHCLKQVDVGSKMVELSRTDETPISIKIGR